jgi:hypothetical protein
VCGPGALALGSVSVVSRSALSDLRRTRRIRRLGDTEWFDVAYNVYLAAILGGGAIITLSGFVGDAPLATADVQRLLQHGPAYLGAMLAIAVALGLRSGANGGPLSIESADARHLLLAPISRGAVLRRPYVQRLRAVVGGAALTGGIAGLLAAQRLPGTSPSWVTSGAAFGACAGLATIAVAVLAHAARVPGWIASVVGGAICAWQLWAAIGGHDGPFDTVGDLALWGDRQHTVDLVGVAIIVSAAIVALLALGRLSVEHLDRRGDLVSQLRFAVTTQDLRTVVLLRRQLAQELPRRRPLAPVPPLGAGRSGAVRRRSVASMLRAPWARFGRIVTLGVGAGIAAGMAARGTTPAIVVCGVLLFVMGLDLIEPLSQEIDHPDRAEDLPVDSGWLHVQLLAGPALFAIPPALAGAVACALVDPAAAVASFALALPITWAGMAGSVINALRDDSQGGSDESVLLPPEVTGMKNVTIMLIPLIVSTLGTTAILALRAVPTTSTGVQLLAALGVYLALFGWWVRKRADLRRSWSEAARGAM